MPREREEMEEKATALLCDVVAAEVQTNADYAKVREAVRLIVEAARANKEI